MSFNIARAKSLYDLSPIKYKLIRIFINYCVNELNIKSDFTVYLTAKNHGIEMTLGAFNPNTNDVFSRYENRYFYDVCRSIAHELVHLSQKEKGKLKDMSKYTDAGGEIENEANAVAGILCKNFPKKYNLKDLIYKL